MKLAYSAGKLGKKTNETGTTQLRLRNTDTDKV